MVGYAGQNIKAMPDAYWSYFLLFALIVLVTSMSVVVYLRQKQARREGNMDNSAWLLTILVIAAILSIGSFIAFIFLHGSFG